MNAFKSIPGFGLIATTLVLATHSSLPGEEFSTPASWNSSNTHGWTLTIPSGSGAKVCAAGEDQILTATPSSGDLSHTGEIRFDVTPGDDETLTVHKAPRVLKSVIDNNADWIIETAIMQPDPNTKDLDKNIVLYDGAFYPKRSSGSESTDVHSHAGLVLRNGTDWILFGQVNNMEMGVTGFVGGSAVNPTLVYPSTDTDKHLFQYFRIRKRASDAGHVRYYFEASGGVNLDDSYVALPGPGSHPGGRYGWIPLCYFEDTNDAFDNCSYGLMARNPAGTGHLGYRVQFSYFYENVPVNELDDFTSTTITTTQQELDPGSPVLTSSGPSSWSYLARKTGTPPLFEPSVISVVTSAATGFTPATSGSNKLVLGIDSTDTFAPGHGYLAPMLLRKPKNTDWIIDTQVIDGDRPSSGQVIYGLIVYVSDTNWIHLGQWTNLSQVRVSGCVGGSYSSQLAGTSTASTTSSPHLFLRIEKDGDDFTFRYSDDAITWTSLGSYSVSSGAFDGAWYGFMGASTNYSQTTSTFTPSFEFFREFAQPDGTVKSVQSATQIVRLIGNTNTDTETPENDPTTWNLNGGDLGSMVESTTNIFMMFGDNPDTNGDHRPNYMAWAPISTTDFTSGFPFADSVASPIPLPSPGESGRYDFGNVTRIPTGGFNLPSPSSNQIYYMFQHIYHWGAPASHWDSSFSQFARSIDSGSTWTTLDPGAGNNYPQWDPDSNFIQTALAKDPTTSNPQYLYIFGTPAGGYGGVKLIRTTVAGIVDKTQYGYYKGGDGTQASAWSTSEADAVTVIPAPVREFSVQYSTALSCWILLAQDDNMRDIELRDAPHPWGPWHNPITAVDHNSPLASYYTNATHYGQSYIYGGYMTPSLMVGTSSPIDVYFTLSKFKPYSVWWDKITLSTDPAP